MAELLSYEAPAHQASDLPLVLPPKLIGREKALGQVYQILKQTKPVLLYGAPGIGKTALAATLARAYGSSPGGALWFSVHHTSLAGLLARIGRAYEVPDLARSENPIGLVGLAMNTLTQHKPLVILDGEPDSAATTEFIMRCADRVPVLVVTDSPSELTGPWTNITLPKLDRAASEVLFRQSAPNASLDGLDTLLIALDDTPLAIVIAAGAVQAHAMTPGEFANTLIKRPGVPSALLALTAAYGKLSAAQQGLLLLLGGAPRHAATAELLSMASGGAPEKAIRDGMDALIATNLVERLDRGGKTIYRLHSLTGAFALSWLRGKGRLELVQGNMRDTLLRYVEKHAVSRDEDALIAEMDNLLALAQTSADAGRRADAERISLALMQAGTFINKRGYVYEFLALRQLGIGTSSVFPGHQASAQPALPFDSPVAAPSPLEQPPAIVIAAEPAITPEDSGPLDVDEDLIASEPVRSDVEGYVEEETEEEDSPVSIASTLNMFAEAALDDEDLDEDDESEPLIRIDEDEPDDEDDADEDDEDDEASAPIGLNSILGGDDFGSDRFEIGDETGSGEPVEDIPADAIDRLRADLIKARQSADRRQQAEILGRIASEQISRGQRQEAVASHSEALNLYELLSDNPGQLTTLERLAALESELDEAAAAATHAASGARLARDLGNEAIERRMLALLGDARVQLGESEEAARAFTDALDLARTAGDRADEGELLLKLGYALLDNGDREQALAQFEDALTLFRAQNRRDKEGDALAALGMASGELDRWVEAINFYEAALYIAREVHNRRQELEQLTNLGFAQVQARNLAQAVLRYRQALHLAFEQDDNEEIVGITVELARMLVESPRHIEITAMLVDAGLAADSNARDLRRLKDRIEDERPAIDPAVNIIKATGTVRDYARNAYSLLDQA